MGYEQLLLDTQTAKRLFWEVARPLPVIDLCVGHSAFSAAPLDRSNLYECWMKNDREMQETMRLCGVEEKYVTGNASDFEKLRAYCHIMPRLIGRSDGQRSQLMLERIFDCRLPLDDEHCGEIWTCTASALADRFQALGAMLERLNVAALGVVTDAASLSGLPTEATVLPTLCPDAYLDVTAHGYFDAVCKFGEAYGVHVADLASLYHALEMAMDAFCARGCRSVYISSFTTDFAVPNEYAADRALKEALQRKGARISGADALIYRMQLLRFLGQQCKKRGLVLQLDTGRAAAKNIYPLLDYLAGCDGLPRTVIYTGSDDYRSFAALSARFGADGGLARVTVTPGGCHQRSGWALEQSLLGYADAFGLGALGALSVQAVSLASLTDHEYVRRVLCRVLGRMWEQGELTCDVKQLEQLLGDICLHHTKRVFDLE